MPLILINMFAVSLAYPSFIREPLPGRGILSFVSLSAYLWVHLVLFLCNEEAYVVGQIGEYYINLCLCTLNP